MASLIRVFEHEYLEVGEKDFKESHWKALGKFNAKHGSKYFTLYPEGIKFNQYVGAIQAGSLTIEILPKADKQDADTKKWHKVLLQMIKECQFLKVEHPDLAQLQLQSNSFLDLYLSLFINEVQKLLHEGLIKRYRKAESNQTSLKGQLLFQQQINKNLVHKERFYVRHTIYDRDHLIHQILAKALKLVNNVAVSPVLKGRAINLLLDFPEVKDIKVTEQAFANIKFDRKTMRYKQVLLISKMLLLNYRPNITGGAEHVLALLFDMNKLWEEYVYRQLVKLNAGWNVSRQNCIEFWQPTNEDAKNLRPDIVIKNHEKGCVVIDTKWKLIDDSYPADDDLQQMFAYAHYAESNNLLLLYPSNKRSKPDGTFIKKHYIAGKEEPVFCSLLKVPLKWDVDEFCGLDLIKTDI